MAIFTDIWRQRSKCENWEMLSTRQVIFSLHRQAWLVCLYTTHWLASILLLLTLFEIRPDGFGLVYFCCCSLFCFNYKKSRCGEFESVSKLGIHTRPSTELVVYELFSCWGRRETHLMTFNLSPPLGGAVDHWAWGHACLSVCQPVCVQFLQLASYDLL